MARTPGTPCGRRGSGSRSELSPLLRCPGCGVPSGQPPGSGPRSVRMVVSTGAGVEDVALVDRAGDGVYDLAYHPTGRHDGWGRRAMLVDTTGDGTRDTALVDTTGDGRLDSAVWTTTPPSLPGVPPGTHLRTQCGNVILIDTTGDGREDTALVDTTGDGYIDSAVPFEAGCCAQLRLCYVAEVAPRLFWVHLLLLGCTAALGAAESAWGAGRPVILGLQALLTAAFAADVALRLLLGPPLRSCAEQSWAALDAVLSATCLGLFGWVVYLRLCGYSDSAALHDNDRDEDAVLAARYTMSLVRLTVLVGRVTSTPSGRDRLSLFYAYYCAPRLLGFYLVCAASTLVLMLLPHTQLTIIGDWAVTVAFAAEMVLRLIASTGHIYQGLSPCPVGGCCMFNAGLAVDLALTAACVVMLVLSDRNTPVLWARYAAQGARLLTIGCRAASQTGPTPVRFEGAADDERRCHRCGGGPRSGLVAAGCEWTPLLLSPRENRQPSTASMNPWEAETPLRQLPQLVPFGPQRPYVFAHDAPMAQSQPTPISGTESDGAHCPAADCVRDRGSRTRHPPQRVGAPPR
eukprot:TRINITY_DN11513_c0_g1_i1.p1 TRINITY_DN11513_c0_g1~~TRINITY_DN11513_c0_g1_i1.p1  ORF type:complete len:600 (+),score=119.74 TRINITY_DN11513_c0_g1_i1:81-1802(+)